MSIVYTQNPRCIIILVSTATEKLSALPKLKSKWNMVRGANKEGEFERDKRQEEECTSCFKPAIHHFSKKLLTYDLGREDHAASYTAFVSDVTC